MSHAASNYQRDSVVLVMIQDITERLGLGQARLARRQPRRGPPARRQTRSRRGPVPGTVTRAVPPP